MEGTHTCPPCKKTFSRHLALREHDWGTHMKVEPYKCPECPFATAYHGSMYVHKKEGCRGENKARFQCPDCDRTYARKENLLEHVAAIHNLRKALTCPECSYVSAYRTSMAKHKWRYHTQKKESRQAEVASSNMFKGVHDGGCESLATPEVKEAMKENIVDSPTVKPTNRLKLGSFNHSENGSYSNKAPATSKATSNKYACEQCPKEYSSPQRLKEHKFVSHLGGLRPYKCPDCTFETSYRSNFSTHKKKRHGGKRSMPSNEDTALIAQKDKLQKEDPIKPPVGFEKHTSLHPEQRPRKTQKCSSTNGGNIDTHVPGKHGHPNPELKSEDTTNGKSDNANVANKKIDEICRLCGFAAENSTALTAHIMETHVDQY